MAVTHRYVIHHMCIYPFLPALIWFCLPFYSCLTELKEQLLARSSRVDDIERLKTEFTEQRREIKEQNEAELENLRRYVSANRHVHTLWWFPNYSCLSLQVGCIGHRPALQDLRWYLSIFHLYPKEMISHLIISYSFWRYFEQRLRATEESYREEIALLQLRLVEGALEDSVLKTADARYTHTSMRKIS